MVTFHFFIPKQQINTLQIFKETNPANNFKTGSPNSVSFRCDSHDPELLYCVYIHIYIYLSIYIYIYICIITYIYFQIKF